MALVQAVAPDVEEGFQSPGWFGVLEDADRPPGRLVDDAGEVHVTTDGPEMFLPKTSAAWDAVLREAKGDYTVRATFRETFVPVSDQPARYGSAIAAEQGDTGPVAYLYCAASADGTFIVGGGGPALKPFRLTGPEAHPAVHKAAAAGEDVRQEIALSVHDGRVQCAINGALVASFDKAAVIGPGKLAATDGVYGFYVGRNREVWVTGLRLTTP